MTHVLVTGGAGFIGSHVTDALLEAGFEVSVLDNLSEAAHTRMPDYLRQHDARYLFHDVRDPDAVARALEGTDAVIHMAAMVGLGVDLGDVGDYVSTNDVGTASLLGSMHRCGFQGPLVLASSMVVYGEGRYSCEVHGVVRPGPRLKSDLLAGRFEPSCPMCGDPLTPQPVPEDAPVDPRNVYAATKLHQEHLCGAWAREDQVPLSVMRYHNVYGPRMPRNTPYAGVASIFRSAVEEGRAPRVFEDGRQIRDFVHVRDVAAATIAPLLLEGTEGVFNIASGDPHTVGDMADELVAAFGERTPRAVRTGQYRLGDVRHVFASIDQARLGLGFTPQVGFAAGVAEFALATLRSPIKGTRTRPRSWAS